MTAYWIYDMPNWVLAVLIVTAAVQIGVIGFWVVRRAVGRLVNHSDKYNDVVSYTFSAVGVFYGLTLGLIAVATWENYNSADDLVTKEASLVGALYRDLEGYPQPTHGDLESRLYGYTQQVIEAEWPAHRKGKSLVGMTTALDDMERVVLTGFTPHCDREKLVHLEVIKRMGMVQSQRQLRLQAVESGLPAVVWLVVLVGGFATYVPMWLLWIENVRLHAILMAIQGVVLGLLIFLTAAMDNPFRGDFSVSAEAFEQVFSRMSKPDTGPTVAAVPVMAPTTTTVAVPAVVERRPTAYPTAVE